MRSYKKPRGGGHTYRRGRGRRNGQQQRVRVRDVGGVPAAGAGREQREGHDERDGARVPERAPAHRPPRRVLGDAAPRRYPEIRPRRLQDALSQRGG